MTDELEGDTRVVVGSASENVNVNEVRPAPEDWTSGIAPEGVFALTMSPLAAMLMVVPDDIG